MELILKAIIMGIVEGITEFVPISSTGHLIIAGQLINFQGKFADLFIIVIQLGAYLQSFCFTGKEYLTHY
jgi:undecaprenyl-diphosphatase